jgi:Leucine-rich repeat (LRR) protein
MAELFSDEFVHIPLKYHVNSSNPSLTNTSITFGIYFRNLTISNQNIPSFVNDTFLSEGLTNLEEISVEFSHLKSIEFRAFNGLTSLRKLSLNDNEISEILPGTFENLSRLKELYLRNNRFKNLNIDVFSGLVRLKVLDLTENELKYLHPDTFLRLPNSQSYIYT